ncbi:MAG: fumarate/nitrate reduction transcriptional regulator Fnr [Gammaproteobacteria bacterium]
MILQHYAPNLSRAAVSCKNCCLSEFCLPTGLNATELEQLINIIHRSPSLPRGKHLFKIGDPIQSLYAVRSGSVKVYVPTEPGEEQVLGFILPGEFLGFDGIEAQHHTCAAVPLETTTVCELPYDRLEELCHALPAIDSRIHKLIGKEITGDHEMLILLGKKTAEERLATFLLSLSARFKQRGFSERDFNLSMSRHEIGNYLGLAVETVSRIFARFQDEGLISVNRRYVEILAMDELKKLVGDCPMDETCTRVREAP